MVSVTARLSRVQMHWIHPLYKLSTCWAQQVERIWTPCWEVLSGVESCWVKFETGQTFRSTRLNISFVSRSSMFGSTKSNAFAQQRSTCWAHARAVPSISKNFQCSRSFHYVVVASFTASTLNPRSCFTTSFFLPFCPHQWVRLLEVQPTIFTFLSHDSTWAFVKSSECSTSKPQKHDVESFLRSFEHPARQHLYKHSTCWELVHWTNPAQLHAALVRSVVL